LLASAVGLLAVVLAVAAGRAAGARRSLRILTQLMVLAVILQGVLGGLTVIYRLPTLVSTAHLGLSMVFFLMTLGATAWSWPGPLAAPAAGEGRARALATGLIVLTWLQVVVGGLVRHLGAGRACATEFPLCAGQIWPVLGPEQLHQLHRLGGLALALVVLAAAPALRAAARRRGRRLALVSATLLPFVVVLQVGLGILTVASSVGVSPVVAHTGGAAALLAAAFGIRAGLGALPAGPSAERPHASRFSHAPEAGGAA
jgi:heme A synthase